MMPQPGLQALLAGAGGHVDPRNLQGLVAILSALYGQPGVLAQAQPTAPLRPIAQALAGPPSNI